MTSRIITSDIYYRLCRVTPVSFQFGKCKMKTVECRWENRPLKLKRSIDNDDDDDDDNNNM